MPLWAKECYRPPRGHQKNEEVLQMGNKYLLFTISIYISRSELSSTKEKTECEIVKKINHSDSLNTDRIYCNKSGITENVLHYGAELLLLRCHLR